MEATGDPSAGIMAAVMAMGMAFMVFYLLLCIFIIICVWRVFSKAGQPGWASIVPIYNIYVMCKIAGKPGWWVILCLIPCVNFIIALLLCLGVAKNFGKEAGFGIGLWLLGIVFLPILAFGKAEYVGEAQQ